jgi:hypothetical protein
VPFDSGVVGEPEPESGPVSTLLSSPFGYPTDFFKTASEAKYPAACECLAKDQEVLFTFYDFPAAHWRHIRTTNPIESTFATVRHRTRQTKGSGSRLATLTMAFKLTREAEKRWQRLHGYRLLDQVIAGAVFVDGELKNAA